MDSSSSRRKLPTKHRWKRTDGTGDTVIDSMKDVVQIHAACGAYCRMPRCRFVQPVYRSSTFYAHFRKEHPEEAQRRGLCVGSPEPLPRLRNVPTGIHRKMTNDGLGLNRKTSKPPNTVVLEYVRKGVDGWYCQIAGNGCPFVKQVLVAHEFRRHFRLEHPREAEQNGFFEAKVQGKTRKRRRQKQPAKTPLQTSHSKQHEANSAQTTPSTDPTTYCRLCFSVTTSLEPIFNRPGDTNLAELIEACTGVCLNADEDGPSSICVGCYRRLNEIQSFRQQCQRLDRIVVGERGEEAKTVYEIEQVLVDESEYLVEMLSPESVEEAEEQPLEEDSDGLVRNDHDREKPEEANGYSRVDQNESFALVMVDEVPYYKCSDCDTMTGVRSTVSRHWNRYHRDGDWKEKKVYCSVSGCSQFFMEWKALKQHLELGHRIRIFR